MARQCIYCGRTLQPGEVCNCRSGGGDRSSARTAAPSSAGTKTADKKNPDPSTSTFRKQPGPGTRASAKAKKTWFRDASRASSTRTPPPRSNATRKTTGAGARSFTGIGARLRLLFKWYTGFARSPIDTALTFAAEPGYEAILLLVGLEAIAAAILAAVGFRSQLFSLSFATLGMTLQVASSVWSAALLAALQSVIRLMLLSGVFYLYLLFLLRVRTGFREIAAAVAPASAPMAVLMLIACFSASSATPLATLTLVLGLLMGILLMFFTFRRLLGLGDNQTAMLLLFGHLLYFSVLSLLVGSFHLLA